MGEAEKMFRDLDLSGVFTKTYLWSVILMFILATVGLIVAVSISP